jgi:hypothetical protein
MGQNCVRMPIRAITKRRGVAILVVVALLISIAIPNIGLAILSDDLDYTCKPLIQNRLECNYRLINPGPVTSFNSRWFWYAVPLASLVALVIAFIILRQVRGRHGSKPFTVAGEVRAYLILHDDNNTHFIISQPRWRIGRDKDNELTLTDHSVSRHHAEIIQNRDGTFMIRDLESLNGVFVNDKKTPAAVLKEGDQIDIGDVRLTFMLHEAHPPRSPHPPPGT